MYNMDNLSEKISSLLSDPKSVEDLKNLAQSLLNAEETSAVKEPESDPVDIAGLMSVLSKIKGTKDSKIELLYALRPHLSEGRKQKLDTAIKLLKIYSVLPLLKESNLLGDLL